LAFPAVRPLASETFFARACGGGGGRREAEEKKFFFKAYESEILMMWNVGEKFNFLWGTHMCCIYAES
jgi:hypothetical protein